MTVAEFIAHREAQKAKHREYNKKYYKENYYWRKERGLCVRCGSEPADKGKTLCWQCRLNDNDRKSVAYYRKADKVA